MDIESPLEVSTVVRIVYILALWKQNKLMILGRLSPISFKFSPILEYQHGFSRFSLCKLYADIPGHVYTVTSQSLHHCQALQCY